MEDTYTLRVRKRGHLVFLSVNGKNGTSEKYRREEIERRVRRRGRG
jgi:hypothetical protein